ncbi:unannotated protein [freshwater metagenome]|uniref:Unannotated protein n=1 Tax=freshwater metagenome TaxID=449393 RepID=A0A6J7HPC1_9ZZZZ
MPAQFRQHPRPGVRLDLAVRCDSLEEMLGSDVRGHDDHRVPEIDLPALRIGDPAVIEHLQQGIEDVGMGLLDLVEEHHGVRLATHRLSELTPLVIPDIPGGRTDEPTHRVPLLVLAHIQAHHVVFAVEEGTGQRLCELGLPHTCRSQEDERTDRPARITDTRPCSDYRVCDQLYRLVLTDDPLVQDLVELQQLLPLAFLQSSDRDTRPCGHDLCDLVFGDHLAQQRIPALPGSQLLLRRLEPAFQRGDLAVPQLGGPIEVVIAFGLLGLVA